MSKSKFPELFEHCVLAIYTGGLRAKGKQGFEESIAIARYQLTKYGYLLQGSETGELERIRLSVKGRKRNREHVGEAEREAKSRAFAELFEWAAKKDDNDPTANAVSEPRLPTTVGRAQTAGKKAQRARHNTKARQVKRASKPHTKKAPRA